MTSNADTLLRALHNGGVRHVLTNAGTDTAPIIEALATAETGNQPLPRFLVTPHENLAVAMAHGHYRASGECCAVLLHTTVGSANAVMGLMNASRDAAPMLVMAGRTPNTEGNLPGARNAHIHWGQESFDQGGMLREWVKWDYELRAGQDAAGIVQRALAITRSAPAAPVYLTLPREVLAAPALDTGAPPPPAVTAASIDVSQLAELISAAELPLILTSSGGRTPGAFAALDRLCSEHAIAVGQLFATDANLPSDHAMNFGFAGTQFVGDADVIVVIEAGVPWIPSATTPRADCKVVSLAADPLYTRYPNRGHRIDLALAGDVETALVSLADRLRPGGQVAARRRRLAALQQQRQDALHAQVEAGRQAAPITLPWLTHCLNTVRSDNAMVINELGLSPDHVRATHARSYMRETTAGGLGFGLGAGIGARLARPDLQVISVVGDGSYMFGNPTPAHFVGRAHGLPSLTIINNNQRWNAVKQAAAGMYPNGAAMGAPQMPLTALTPSPAYEQVVMASDGYGERVEDPAQLCAAIERGLQAVADGRPAVLNVLTA